MKMRIKESIAKGAKLLSGAEVDSASLDARVLMKSLLKVSNEELLARYDFELSEPQMEAYNKLIERRELGEPIAYITGEREFYGRSFVVNKDVLIPRNDSEILIDSVTKFFPDLKARIRFLDIGTGSGCLLLTALAEYQNASGIGVDVSGAALKVAEQNAISLNLTSRVEFIESDLFEKLSEQEFDVILCNPPYIATSEKQFMNRDTDFEPRLALFADEDGLFFYKKIAKNIDVYMADKSRVFFEIGFAQKNQVAEIYENCNLSVVAYEKDLAQIVRCLVIQK